METEGKRDREQHGRNGQDDRHLASSAQTDWICRSGCDPRSAAVRDANKRPSGTRCSELDPNTGGLEVSASGHSCVIWVPPVKMLHKLSDDRSGLCSGSLSCARPLLMPFNELLSLSLPVFRSDFYRIAGVEPLQKKGFQLLFGRALFVFPD